MENEIKNINTLLFQLNPFADIIIPAYNTNKLFVADATGFDF